LVFQIDVTEPALADAEDYVRFIREVKNEPEAAQGWFRGLIQAIYSLEELPEGCPIIPDARRVIVYRVYHGSRKILSESDLQ
jgi:plasmid stabilization system protein ParE